jgi:GNAT superfamily N-acetyltransferase
VRAVDDGFVNRALGFGTIADASGALLARVERHYASLGRAPRIAIATGFVPLAAIRLLERSGYAPQPETAELIYLYDRRSLPVARAVDGLVIERVRARDADVYARVAYASFAERGEPFRLALRALVRRRADGRTLRAYLGRVDDAPAATGMLFDARPIAWLGNGSVLPAFRGRRIQSAMMVHRMQAARRRGLDLFFAQPQNPASAHNLAQLGWRLLYREVDWVKR